MQGQWPFCRWRRRKRVRRRPRRQAQPAGRAHLLCAGRGACGLSAHRLPARHLDRSAGRRRRAVGLRQCLGRRAAGARRPSGGWPMTGRPTSSSRRPRSGTPSTAISAGTIRRRFCSSPPALSLLPYAPAYLLWVFGTFPAYLAAIRAIIGDRVGYLLAAAFPAVLGNFVVGPERLPHRRSHRRRARAAGAAADRRRRAARAPQLQAASRLAVSDRARGGRPLARVRDRRDRRDADGGGLVARLRQRHLAGVLCQYRPHLAGLSVRWPCRLQQAANRLRTGPHARRQRGAGVDRASRGRPGRGSRDRLAVAERRRLRDQGRGACRRRHAGDAVSLYLRPRGARRYRSPSCSASAARADSCRTKWPASGFAAC